jgi:hypothetical protein
MRALFFLILAGAHLASYAQPTVITSLADSGPGSLRLAIFNSSPGDTIVMSPNLIANGSDTLYFSSYISITHSLTIIGAMNSTDTLFFSGNNLTRLFEIIRVGLPSVDVHFKQVAIVDAYYNNNGAFNILQGAAVQLIGPGNFSFRKCLFKNNYGTDNTAGAGINCSGSNLTIDSCIFTRNEIDSNWYGGAIRLSSSQVDIRSSHFSENDAKYGSDIYAGSSTIVIDKCFFEGTSNTSRYSLRLFGAGLKAIIENSTFISPNRAHFFIFQTDKLLLRNNQIIRMGNGTLSLYDQIESKALIVENNTYTSSVNVIQLFISFSDSLTFNKNTLNMTN